MIIRQFIIRIIKGSCFQSFLSLMLMGVLLIPVGCDKHQGITIYHTGEPPQAYGLTPDSTKLKSSLDRTTGAVSQDTKKHFASNSTAEENDHALSAKSIPVSTRLKVITVTPLEDYLIVNVVANGIIKNFKTFTINENPPRIVFDLFHLESPYKTEQRVEVKGKWASRVRHFGYPDKVRLVVDTKEGYLSKYSVTPIETGLLIQIGGVDAADNKSTESLVETPALSAAPTPTEAKSEISTAGEQPITSPLTTEELAKQPTNAKALMDKAGEAKASIPELPRGVVDFRVSPGDVLRVEAQPVTKNQEPFRLDTEDVILISFYYGGGSYHIMPGDEIRTTVTIDSTRNFDTTVRLDGSITIPGVAEVQAAGTTPRQLSATIAKAYRNLINDGRNTVTVLRTNTASVDSMAGEYTILPDGSITIPVLGRFQTAGLTPAQLAAELSLSVRERSHNNFRASVIPRQFTPRRLAEYDRTVVISPAGEIMLPDVGTVQAASLTMPDLQREVQKKIQSRYLRPVSVSVGLVSSVSRSVIVSGQVRQPGPYSLAPDMTMLKAVMLAGGTTSEGDLNEVVLIHYNGDGGVTVYKTNLREVIDTASPLQDLRLSPQDVVYVPQAGVAQANQFIEQYINRMLPFSRSVSYNFNRGMGQY